MNGKAYIHEFIDIRGHHRADYMQHMAANWSPLAQQTRNQRCFGVFAVLGSTGPWPQVVNLWEEDGFAGLAASFEGEAIGAGAQDPALAKWWAKAAELRRGGFDRILRPAPWTRTIDELCEAGVQGACYAHELVSVRAGTAGELLERVRGEGVALHERLGLELVGAWRTTMVDDDECVLLWAIPSWAQWAAYEEAHEGDGELRAWVERSRELVTGRHRILLVDAPLSPLRTGRQPSVDDRTDWVD
jgi:hypothetical protein